jgi:hypothetical protein
MSEAGGRVTDLSGHLHDELLSLLADLPHGPGGHMKVGRGIPLSPKTT